LYYCSWRMVFIVIEKESKVCQKDYIDNGGWEGLEETRVFLFK